MVLDVIDWVSHSRFENHGEYSEEYLTSIIEKYSIKPYKQPRENEWFDVDPASFIEQDIFKQPRENWSEERTRQIIIEAFEEAKRNPTRYLKRFRTMFPKRTWGKCEYTDKVKCIQISSKFGDHQADWVEQALEWAQCISNNIFIGWRNVCNLRDTSKNFRVVKWKDGKMKRVGGSTNEGKYGVFFPSFIEDYNERDWHSSFSAVPLIVSYDFSAKSKNAFKEKTPFLLYVKEQGFTKEDLEIVMEAYENNIRATKVPIENEWFEVDPKSINLKKYLELTGRRKTTFYSSSDERLAKFENWIYEALKVIEKNPERYSKKFKTMFPTKTWGGLTTPEICKEISSKLGDHQADWVEQALEFLQRIENGYPYRAISTDVPDDNANWYKIIKVYGDGMDMVGCSNICRQQIGRSWNRYQADRFGFSDSMAFFAVPLIVSYD